MRSSVHVDNKKKDILILDNKGPTRGLDDTTLTTEKEYSINFSEQHKKFCLSLHYNGLNKHVFINGVELFKFEAKNSEINTAPLCLGNVLKKVSVDNMKKTRLYGYTSHFSIDYDATAVYDILDIHKYLMKKNDTK